MGGHTPSDPSAIATRTDLTRALKTLRSGRDLTVRQVAERSRIPLATIGGWLSGRHVPTEQNSDAFFAVLRVCGVTNDADATAWWDAVRRVRRSSDRRPDDTPYKGLDSFGPDDSEWFFGRDRFVDELVDRVGQEVGKDGSRFLVVTGASGTGKSSLLRAGLMARIEVDDSAFGGATVTTPGPDPLASLADVPTDGTQPWVVVVDQAEELWNPAVSTEVRARYLTELDRLSRVDGPSRCVVVMAMRADFYAAALDEPVLLAALSSGPLVLGPMTADEIREVIVAPARRAGAEVDEALVELLLSDLVPAGSTVASEPGVLPLLSHALYETWSRATTKILNTDDYRATGGISGAVQQSAEQVYRAMTTEQQLQARRVLLRLVTVDGDTVTRRRAPLTEFDDSDVTTVVDNFASARLLTVDEDYVQVTHEALLAVWTRLREWIDSDRAWFVNLRMLTQSAAVWVDADRDPSALLGTSRFGFYRDLLAVGDRDGDLNELEREYLSASDSHLLAQSRVEDSRTRTRRRLVAGLAVVTAVAIALSVTAFVLRSEAVDQRTAADSAREEAMSRQIAAQALALRERDPAVSAQLALAAYRAAPTFEARSMLLDSTGVDTPVRLTGPAGITTVAASPTAPSIIVGRPGEVEFVSTVDGLERTIRTATLDSAPVYAVSYSPGGDLAAVGTALGVELFDLSDPSRPNRIWTADLPNPARALTFSPDGGELAIATSGPSILRFGLDSRTDPNEMPGLDLPGSSSTRIAYSPDGRFLAGAGSSRSLRIWNTDEADRLVVDVPADESTYSYLALDYSPSGNMLAAGSTGREIRRWAVGSDGTVTDLPALTGFRGYVQAVAFDPDGRRLVGGSGDNSTRIWNLEDLTAVSVDLPGPASVLSTDFDSDSGDLVTGDETGTVRRWVLPGRVLSPAGDTLFTNPANASGTTVLGGVGIRGPGAQLWDVTDIDRPRLSKTLLDSTDGSGLTGASALSWDGEVAVLGTDTGGFQLWATSPAEEPRPLGSVNTAVTTLTAALAFERDRSVLAVAGQNASDVSLWSLDDTSRPRQLAVLEVEGLPTVISFSPVAQILGIATSSGTVELWDTANPAAPTRLHSLVGFDSDATSVAFSRDGSLVAAGGADRSIRLWDVMDPVRPLQLDTAGATAAITSLGFSPDGRSLSVGTGTDALMMWSLTEERRLDLFASLTAAGARINDPAYLDGGSTVAGGGENGRIHLWRNSVDDAVAAQCARIGTPISEDEWNTYVQGVPFVASC